MQMVQFNVNFMKTQTFSKGFTSQLANGQQNSEIIPIACNKFISFTAKDYHVDRFDNSKFQLFNITEDTAKKFCFP